MEPEQQAAPEPQPELTFGQKVKFGLQGAGMMIRNPKAIAALVKYKLAERKSAKEAG